MPELPEVETVKRGLAPALEGRCIKRAWIGRPDLRFPFPKDFTARLEGCRVTALSRRAKYILAHLDSAEILMMHLGMSGRFTVLTPRGGVANLGEFYYLQPAGETERGPHDHVVFTLDDDSEIIYTDHRRFGMMDLVAENDLDAHKLMRNVGVEPLGNRFDAVFLAEAFRNKRTNLKAALLDQRIIAGLGNIYVCEALFRSGLSPERVAATLPGRRAPGQKLERLVRVIREVLQEAIDAGGSTLRDFAAADGSEGGYQQVFTVYDREAEACVNAKCRGTVMRIVQSGRSTFYCPHCQR